MIQHRHGVNRYFVRTCLLLVFIVFHALVAPADEVTLQNVAVVIRHVDYEFAIKENAYGLRTMDWDKFKSRPQKIVDKQYEGIRIENEAFRVTLVPNRGRVHSMVNKVTGNEMLWINPCALPLGANNDTGFWMTWGGVERVLPRREHGTTHALDWSHKVLSKTDRQATVSCEVTEPLTGLHLKLHYSLYADKPFLETKVIVSNPTKQAQRFSAWTTAVLAPGGLNEVTPNTELVFPADKLIPDDRDFNDWMVQLAGPASTSPLRYVKNWKSIGDLMTSPLHRPYYAVYSHEKREGIVHTFDLHETPTVDVWGWGYPPTPARQSEFTAEPPNKGYIEVWNGNVHGFKDDALATLEPGGVRTWHERTFAIRNVGRQDLRREIRDGADKASRAVELSPE